MTRSSHPPTLLRLVERELRNGTLLRRGELVVVAVSGGPDSLALAHCLHCMAAKFGFEMIGCAIDHGLRAEAANETRLAQEALSSWGRACERISLSVDAGGNLMERARLARHGALQAFATDRKASKIALGHHADDRAETVLMRLLRGSGLGGLAVLPAQHENLIRPMIRAKRSDILAHLDRHGIPYALDPSNENPRFERASVRHQVIPLLQTLSPRIVDHLNHLADDALALGLDGSREFRRAHLTSLARAAQRTQSITIALPGNRFARFDKRSGVVTVHDATQEQPEERAPNEQSQ